MVAGSGLMPQIEPPPHKVEKFVFVWKEWLNRLWIYVKDVYSELTTHTDKTNWNAHGNTATGNIDGSDRLKIENASFWIDNGAGAGATKTATGDYPSGAENQGGVETKLLWYGKAGAFRAGLVGNDAWDEAKIGAQSFAVGVNTEASGSSSIAIGDSNLATQNYASAIGNGNTCSGFFTAAYGYNCTVSSGFVGVAIGNQCNVSGSGAFVIGSGAGAGTKRFANSQANSVAIGANINSGAGDKATLFLINKKCGVENESPLSTLDIGGSVGFQYSLLTGSNGGSDTLSDEYVVIVDVQNVTTNYTVQLPDLGASTIDRRIYYIKIVSLDGAYTASATLNISPGASDAIEDLENTTNGPGTLLADNTDLAIPMNNAIGNSYTFMADNTRGGWWLI